MVRYCYKAKTKDGKLEKGIVELDNEAEFYRYMGEKKLYCISVHSKQTDNSVSGSHTTAMSPKILSVFCREFAVMLSSGMNIMTALQLLYERENKPKIKDCYMRMIEGIEKGDTLYDAMRKQGKIFPKLLVSMVLAGESSGMIDQVMEKMATYYEKEMVLKAKIQNALIYPCMLISVTICVIIILFTFVLPQFFSLFSGQDLPGITVLFMNISHFLVDDWYILIIVIFGAAVLFLALKRSEKFQMGLDRLSLKIPVIGRLLEKILIARFSNAMNILYSSGITIIRCLEIGSSTISNTYLAGKLVLAREMVEKGVVLSQAMENQDIFDKMFWSMLHIGEESGNLEMMFLKLSEYYEKESEQATQKMMSIMEPVILIIIAIVVGTVIASVLLPIYGGYQII